MNALKKYIIENIKKVTTLHSVDIDEDNVNISDIEYENNYNTVEKILKDISDKIYFSTEFIIVCDIYLYSNGSIGIDVHDNRLYKQILHYDTIF